MRQGRGGTSAAFLFLSLARTYALLAFLDAPPRIGTDSAFAKSAVMSYRTISDKPAWRFMCEEGIKWLLRDRGTYSMATRYSISHILWLARLVR
jgi:hypothetical protein